MNYQTIKLLSVRSSNDKIIECEIIKPQIIKCEIIKICGALIRVVNDKFPPELKIQIFYALKLILIKASAAVRAMVPQL